MPEPKDGFTFETLIKNREEVEHFKNFLTKKHGRGRGHCFFFYLAFFHVVFTGIRELPLPFLANAEPQGFKSFFNYS